MFETRCPPNDFCFSFYLNLFREAFLDVSEEVISLQGLLVAETSSISQGRQSYSLVQLDFELCFPLELKVYRQLETPLSLWLFLLPLAIAVHICFSLSICSVAASITLGFQRARLRSCYVDIILFSQTISTGRQWGAHLFISQENRMVNWMVLSCGVLWTCWTREGLRTLPERNCGDGACEGSDGT